MIKINLLPIREIKRRQKAKQQIATFCFGILLFLVALGLIALYLMAQTARLETKLDGLKKETAKYTKILQEIKELEADKAVLKNQIMVIDQLKESSSLTVHLLDDVARRTPKERIWLNSLSQSGQNLTINGMALDNRTVAKYMDDLRTSPYIHSVSLATASMQTYAGRKLKSFSLSCAVGSPVDDATSDKQETKK
ncbi:MAG: pilus assembly protein PilN [Desulfobulbus propionicus]|nr:MAG: pilus assembly protein PilN [Desulfobulbus propionicus]